MTSRTKGIFAILLSAFGFALMATFVRLCDDYGGTVSSFQKSFFRNSLALVMAAVIFLRSKKRNKRQSPLELSKKTWGLLVLRSVLGTIGIFANFYALSHITIAEGQTLNKTAPFFTVLLSWLFLGERVNFRQMFALSLAFGGVLLIAKPGFAGSSTFPLLMGLLGGACAGGAYTAVHRLGLMKVNGAFIVLFFSAFSCLASVPFMLVNFDKMTFAQILTLFGAGFGAVLGQFGITAAYRYAAPRQIAVYDYSNIIFTSIFGFALFGQIPDFYSLAGFVLIVLAAIRMRG